MEWEKILINPYLRRSFLGIHVDYSLGKLVVPIHSQWNTEGQDNPRQVIHYGGGNNWTMFHNTNQSWAAEYDNGDSWNSPSSIYPRGIIDMITYNNYYINRWEYSTDLGCNWIRFTDIGARNPQGWSQGGRLYHNFCTESNRVCFNYSDNFGASWHKVYDEPVLNNTINGIGVPSGNYSGNVIVANLSYITLSGFPNYIGVSYNGGASWSKKEEALEQFEGINQTAISESGGTMLAASRKYLWRSNGTTGFVKVLNATAYHSGGRIRGIRYLDKEGIVLVPISAEEDYNDKLVEWIAYSTNDGASFSSLPLPTPALKLDDGWSKTGAGARGAQCAYYGGALYIAQPVTGLLWRTYDWGNTWEAIWNEADEGQWQTVSGAEWYPSTKMSGDTITFDAGPVDGSSGSFENNMGMYSTDRGKTFKPLPRAHDDCYVMMRNKGVSVIAVTADGGGVSNANNYCAAFITHSGGASWNIVNLSSLITGSYPYISAIAADKLMQNILVVIKDGNYKLLYSPNWGTSFSIIRDYPDDYGSECGISGDGSTMFYGSDRDSLMYKSVNAGASWESIGYFDGQYRNTQVNDDGSIAAISSRSAIRIYKEGEVITLSPPVSAPSYSSINFLMNDDASQFIAIGHPGDIAWSIDGGNTWTEGDPLETDATRRLYYAEAYNNTTIAGPRDFSSRLVASETAPYFWYSDDPLTGGLIKAISSALFRPTNKYIIGVERKDLKKISSQPDDPRYLP